MMEKPNEFGAVNGAQLDVCEMFLGTSLPSDYRAFLLESNGGKPALAAFAIGSSNSSRVQYFYGIHRGPSWSNLVGTLKNYENRMPEGILPIGGDPFGNQVCLALRRNRGAIYFWDHEGEADQNETSPYRNMTKLAASFTEFLRGLRADDIPAAAAVRPAPAESAPWWKFWS